MDHLDQATIDDNTTEANLEGYTLLYAAIKNQVLQLGQTLEGILSQIVEGNTIENKLYPFELIDVLNRGAFAFKSKEGDLSKEDIINLCNRTRDLSKYLFQKGNELLDFAGEKAKELNTVMVQKVPLYKLYRDIGMFFISTGLVLSLLIGAQRNDQPLETVIFEEAYGGNTFGPTMMDAVARYLTEPQFIKQVFGVDADILNLSVEFGKIIGLINGYEAQLTVKATENGVSLSNDSYSHRTSRIPEEGDEFNFHGYTMPFNASGELRVNTFDYPESAADILQVLGIEDVDATKVSSIVVDFGTTFIVDANKKPDEPGHLVVSGGPQISVTIRSEVEADDADTFRYDGEMVETIRTFYISEVEFNEETGLPENLMGNYAAILDYIARKYPHIPRSD